MALSREQSWPQHTVYGGWVGGGWGVQRYCEIVPVCESITYSPPVSQPLASDHKYYSASVHWNNGVPLHFASLISPCAWTGGNKNLEQAKQCVWETEDRKKRAMERHGSDKNLFLQKERSRSRDAVPKEKLSKLSKLSSISCFTS